MRSTVPNGFSSAHSVHRPDEFVEVTTPVMPSQKGLPGPHSHGVALGGMSEQPRSCSRDVRRVFEVSCDSNALSDDNTADLCRIFGRKNSDASRHVLEQAVGQASLSQPSTICNHSHVTGREDFRHLLVGSAGLDDDPLSRLRRPAQPAPHLIRSRGSTRPRWAGHDGLGPPRLPPEPCPVLRGRPGSLFELIALPCITCHESGGRHRHGFVRKPQRCGVPHHQAVARPRAVWLQHRPTHADHDVGRCACVTDPSANKVPYERQLPTV